MMPEPKIELVSERTLRAKANLNVDWVKGDTLIKAGVNRFEIAAELKCNVSVVDVRKAKLRNAVLAGKIEPFKAGGYLDFDRGTKSVWVKWMKFQEPYFRSLFPKGTPEEAWEKMQAKGLVD